MAKYFTDDFENLSDGRKVEELAAQLVKLYSKTELTPELVQALETIVEQREFLEAA
jgi:hypothetical protein